MSELTHGYGHYENISTPKDSAFIFSHADVFCDADGYFVSVETCPSEGHAHMTLPAAKLVYEALGRTIQAAEKIRNILAERERCAKIAEEAEKEILNAPHSLGCKNEWHGNARTPCTCFKAKAIKILARIRSGE